MWPPSSLLEDYDRIRTAFGHSLAKKPKITVILGNGATRAAATEAKLVRLGPVQPSGWNDAVRSVHKEVCGGSTSANDLVLAEAISRKPNGRERLLDRIESALQSLQPCQLHRELSALNPTCWITTNYDTLIERQLAKIRASWGCMVGLAGSDTACPETAVFKIHGSFIPDCSLGTCWAGLKPGSSSIVISESDYDQRLYQLMCAANAEASQPLASGNSAWASLFWEALCKNTVLVVGKGLYWEDLSFNYVLKVRERRLRALGEKPASTAFWLEPDLPPSACTVLQNMGITPAVAGLPNKREDIHYYYAGLASLRELVLPGVPSGGSDRDDAPFVAVKAELSARRPVVLAAGLSAYNVAGVLDNRAADKSWQLPLPGRRNLSFLPDRVEEYAGGAALTAIAVFSALAKRNTPCAIVSNIGDDHYAPIIERFCDEWNIDHDGAERSKDCGTWRSTILVHDAPNLVPTKDGTTISTHVAPEGRGQRWFLDHAKGDRDWSAPQVEQFNIGLDSAAVLYLDKWFAKRGPRGIFEVRPQPMDVLRTAIEQRQNLDVLYETGGNGTQDGQLELTFGTVVNIMTAGCGFFCLRIVADSDDPFERVLTFHDELAYIDRMLTRHFDLRDRSGWGTWCDIPRSWRDKAKQYVRADARRRWLIATLHSRGAVALDVEAGRMCYLMLPTNYSVANTAGAGDSFRGAVCYALAQLSPGPSAPPLASGDELLLCTRFSIDMASLRCSFPTMKEALDNFEQTGEDAWNELLNEYSDRSKTAS